MNIIFTDIDGVLNPRFRNIWDKKCISIYNRICEDFDLCPVITSTWRIRYNKKQLQEIFIQQGIKPKIYDYTSILSNDRGLEIHKWLKDNEYNKYVIIDDKISDIIPYVSNVVHCKGYIGLTKKCYDEIKNIMNYDNRI